MSPHWRAYATWRTVPHGHHHGPRMGTRGCIHRLPCTGAGTESGSDMASMARNPSFSVPAPMLGEAVVSVHMF